MPRIMIIGGSGSGKSTLAREIGDRLGVPVIHMDALFWQPDWVMAAEDDFLSRVAAATAKEHWVMDGNYSRTWPMRLVRADAVVFLDVPTWLRLWRVIRRTALHYGRTRADLGAGCPEKVDFGFIFGWVTRYHHAARPKALALMAQNGPAGHTRRYHLRSRADVEACLRSLAADCA